MSNGKLLVRQPANEPVKSYLRGSAERTALEGKLKELSAEVIEIPLIIGGKEVRTGITRDIVMPHDHGHILAKYHLPTEKELNMAVEASLEARQAWASLSWDNRAAIFLKAAELLAGPWRATLNAATMLGQSKTAHQAEIDSACELIDFLRFNVFYMQEIFEEQPISLNTELNRIEYRPLEGFVLAITPFNFTAIGGNLATSPAMLGNVVNWKPSDTAVYSNYFFMKLLQEAGLPDGVINFLPCTGEQASDTLIPHPNLGGVNFTGSTAVFEKIWNNIGKHIGTYKDYPRLVGETGGKDFIFAHNSCDVDALVTALTRGAFEYQGQKCSAASRAYIPESIWPEVKEKLGANLAQFEPGDVSEFSAFMGAVIDHRAYDKITSYIDAAKNSKDADVIFGGGYDCRKGYFVEPTVIQAKTPTYKSMCEEIFGPVLTLYVYEDTSFEETLKICDETSPYALTGAVFAQDKAIIQRMDEALKFCAGNFYINDKPTGAVVGQQPFGGARKSGTNDKAGSKVNLYRFINMRTIKENLVPPTEFKYAHMLD